MHHFTVSDKIRIEEIDLSMAPVIFKAIENNRENLKEWLPFIEMTNQISDTKAFIRSITNQTSPAKDIVYCIWYNQEFAGLIGLKEIDWLNKKAELGYWMIPKMEGKGIMTKCVNKIVRYCFKKLKLNRIQIKVAIGNNKSAAIPKRLGFTFEGIEREGEYHQGGYMNLQVFSLLKSELKIQ